MKKTGKFLAAVLAAAALVCGCAKEEYDVLNYDLSKYITLGTYKGIAVNDMKIPEITDDDLKQHIEMARSNYATVAEKKGPAVLNDQLIIDFFGTMDGKSFEGGSADDFEITLGSGTFIAGFEEGLVGAAAGDTVTLDLTFPNPYSVAPELAGKPVQFKVAVKHVYEVILPAYTDEFVKQYYKYDTTALFEEALRASLLESYENQRMMNIMSQAWAVVTEEAKIHEYPKDEYDTLYANYIGYYTQLAEEKGMSLNEYAQESMGKSVKDFEVWIRLQVEESLKKQLIINAIARAENIKISNEEYREIGGQYAKKYGLSSVGELEMHMTPAEIRQSILHDKVMEFLAEQADIKK